MENLKKLVGIKSNKNCNEILNFLQKELKNKVFDLKIYEKDKKIMLIGINTKLKNIQPVLLSGHIDTVDANEQQYDTNPYELTEKNGKFYGLGSIDMKSFTAIVMDNLEALKQLEYPIVLALTTDEETTIKSVELVTKKFAELNIKPKFTIIGEPTQSQFNLASNGCYEYSVKFFGKACHSSKPNEGINAICACAKLVNFIETEQKKYNITSNCGKICGGEVINKVADYAELQFDVRSLYSLEAESFLHDINKYLEKLQNEYFGLKIEISKLYSIPSFDMTQNKKIVSMAKELDIKTNIFSGGCEAGYYTNYSGDAVIYGVGDLSLAHKPNEYVEAEEYKAYSKTCWSAKNNKKVLFLIIKYHFYNFRHKKDKY